MLASGHGTGFARLVQDAQEHPAPVARRLRDRVRTGVRTVTDPVALPNCGQWVSTVYARVAIDRLPPASYVVGPPIDQGRLAALGIRPV